MNEEETYSIGQDIKAFDEKQQIQPTQQLYPSPFGYKFGTSSVDLSIEANHNTMKNEYDQWWTAKGEDRAKLQEAFNEKYFNMSTEDVRKAQREQALEDHNPLKRLDNTFQGLSAPGMGLFDFVMDAAGTVIPGFNQVDEKFDKATMLDNPTHQAIRRISSIVLPSI